MRIQNGLVWAIKVRVFGRVFLTTGLDATLCMLVGEYAMPSLG